MRHCSPIALLRDRSKLALEGLRLGALLQAFGSRPAIVRLSDSSRLQDTAHGSVSKTCPDLRMLVDNTYILCESKPYSRVEEQA